MFHDDSTVEGREGIDQIMPQVSDDDGDSHVPCSTLVDDSKVEIVAVGEVADQEDGYDTDSGNDMDDDDHDSYPHTTTLTRSYRAIRAHFRLDFKSLHDRACAYILPCEKGQIFEIKIAKAKV